MKPRDLRVFSEPERRQWENPPAKVPEVSNPLVRLLFRRMIQLQISYRRVEQESGVSFWTLRSWRGGADPTLNKLAAALGVVGYAITATPIKPQDKSQEPSQPC